MKTLTGTQRAALVRLERHGKRPIRTVTARALISNGLAVQANAPTAPMTGIVCEITRKGRKAIC